MNLSRYRPRKGMMMPFTVSAALQPQEPAMFTDRRDFPSDPAHVGAARAFVLSHLDPNDPRRDDLRLCTSEVVTNAVVHAAPNERAGGVRVAVHVTDTRITVIVGDGGSDTDPTVLRARGSDETNGRGLAIVEKLADAWGVRRCGRSVSVWFTLAFPLRHT